MLVMGVYVRQCSSFLCDFYLTFYICAIFIYVCPMLLLSDFFVFLMVMHCYDGCLSDFFVFFFTFWVFLF